MAMRDDMDELLSLYRKVSQEAPSPMTDARILRTADKVAAHRRRLRHALWPAAAAACVLLWSAWQGHSNHPARNTIAMAGYDAGASRAELLRMDVTPPHSDVDHFLLDVTRTYAQPTTRNAP